MASAQPQDLSRRVRSLIFRNDSLKRDIRSAVVAIHHAKGVLSPRTRDSRAVLEAALAHTEIFRADLAGWVDEGEAHLDALVESIDALIADLTLPPPRRTRCTAARPPPRKTPRPARPSRLAPRVGLRVTSRELTHATPMGSRERMELQVQQSGVLGAIESLRKDLRAANHALVDPSQQLRTLTIPPDEADRYVLVGTLATARAHAVSARQRLGDSLITAMYLVERLGVRLQDVLEAHASDMAWPLPEDHSFVGRQDHMPSAPALPATRDRK